MRILLTAIALLLTSFTANATVDMEDPNQVVDSVSTALFARLNAEQPRLQKEPNYIHQVIEEELIPFFDYKYTAYKVVGPHLKKTSKLQRKQFVDVFKTHLVNIYGHILLQYQQQQIEILENSHFKGKTTISIAVRIRDQNTQVAELAFKLRKNKKTGQWKVFDIIAEGISMLSTKQSELNSLIQKKGIDHVIDLLAEKNSEFSS